MIFVNIYSFRDMETDATIKDLFAKADKPEEIIVGLLNADDVDYVYDGEYQVKTINKPFEQYHGCGRACWEIQTQLFNEEEWFMKIDPHSRFLNGWDTYYKNFAGKDRVITSRCLGYHTDGSFDKLKRHYSRPVGWHNTEVTQLAGTDTSIELLETLFMQAGCFFAPGDWVRKVGHDPYVALWGEETDLSMRTIMAGYKIFNVQSAVFHLYERQNRKSTDQTMLYEKLNRAGIERVKIKLGIREPDNELFMRGWDEWGCDGSEYKEKIERLWNA